MFISGKTILSRRVFTITNTLTNCTSSNSATSINYGSQYSATITANSGYTLENAVVTVTMDGVDVTSTAYNNGVISISSVTGSLVITIVAQAVQPTGLTAYATAQPGVTYTAVSDLSSYTDAKIEEISKAISNCQDITLSTETIYLSDATSISVGATRSYSLSTQEAMTDEIIGFNHDTLTSSTAYGEATATGKAGMTWQMVDCLATRYRMNDTATNAGGWNVCEMRTTTLPTIKLTMPQSLQNIIKTVDKKSANGSGSSYTAIVTSQDQLFLIAEIELYGSVTNAEHGSDEGSIYKYWALHTNNTDKIKKYLKDNVMQDTQWWQRSCYYIDNNRFTCTYIAGDSGYIGAEKTRGLSFLYCT